ncbi:protein MAIN-LIKE 1-like [Amborella trichopoda]|uniref:protein MAIN-LIKE 1-like n=1 Tax=Amborella trichopoda TaxID=13333 RepID=UPI0009BE7077|nr:protein MAIN-LIKE 1-like [Amborella trichopoda]|eukprot:XP_020525041.1 protein MAIN-LIKE 1-like [Amborella trichopoda]
MSGVHPEGGYPGGPPDLSLLQLYQEHSSYYIWEGHEKQEMRIDEKTFQLNDWHLTEEQVQLVNPSGLGALNAGRIDHTLVAANAESDLHKFIEDNLGIVPTRGNLTTIKYSWLKVNFRGLPSNASPVEIVKYTRAYLLFLISVTIFANASVATVPTRYLQFFEDIGQASRYTWGATALAYLYRSLEKTCTFKRRHFSGSATLMQGATKNYYGNPHNLMPPIKQELVNLQPNEIIWNSYFKLDEAISDDKHEAFETAMCVTTLIFDDIAEPYMPDRVCRQFGAKQGILRNPLSIDIEVGTANGLPSEEYKA